MVLGVINCVSEGARNFSMCFSGSHRRLKGLHGVFSQVVRLSVMFQGVSGEFRKVLGTFQEFKSRFRESQGD